ncbi:TetR/AcrR family transcriptional regulator [Salipaludibacillus aurantiacus]|uniref:DNA-binding transcriptional regulator, AcrR family n=1 Tax=Salipaludibacillus aurantiacus TaxID=1601833 RepID=A0A1H9VBT9_9BACI|nr:TetR/AcrR family transcriptional regulator [Salipaludibacillus aurantiacus]SES19145.1 DNA-binding transcriptional regulator, AcrR family [Salipaludibacillus aurantiacus]
MKKKDVPSLVKDQRLIKKRRGQIIKAAVLLFNEKGYHKATTREVAKASGFSIGTLYEYIGSKEDILYLVCDAVYDEVMGKWEKLRDGNLEGLDRLYQVIEAYFRVIHSLQDEVLVLYQESKSLSDDALAYVLEKEMSMKAMFEKELKEARNSGIISLHDEEISLACHNILVAGHMWTFRRWAVQRDHDIDSYCKWQIAQLFRGFGLNKNINGTFQLLENKPETEETI